MGRTTSTEPQCLYKGALYLYFYLYVLRYLTRRPKIQRFEGFDIVLRDLVVYSDDVT